MGSEMCIRDRFKTLTYRCFSINSGFRPSASITDLANFSDVFGENLINLFEILEGRQKPYLTHRVPNKTSISFSDGFIDTPNAQPRGARCMRVLRSQLAGRVNFGALLWFYFYAFSILTNCFGLPTHTIIYTTRRKLRH